MNHKLTLLSVSESNSKTLEDCSPPLYSNKITLNSLPYLFINNRPAGELESYDLEDYSSNYRYPDAYDKETLEYYSTYSRSNIWNVSHITFTLEKIYTDILYKDSSVMTLYTIPMMIEYSTGKYRNHKIIVYNHNIDEDTNDEYYDEEE